MNKRLPAVIIGGPPHAGKSVLFYSLTQVLRERGVTHHILRACPDGEGNWSQEADPQLVDSIRQKHKGVWPDSFVQNICQALEHRCFPLLVDMGGCPTATDFNIMRLCTHAILLLKKDAPDSASLWRRYTQEHDLDLLGDIESQRGDGTGQLTEYEPLIRGTITGLERGNGLRAHGPVFDALVERLATLFNASMPQDSVRFRLEQAPTQVLNLEDFVPTSERWQPEMLPAFLEQVPTYKERSIYGKAPTWVYAALAGHIDSHLPFHQFDPNNIQFGWGQPVAVRIGTEQVPAIQAKVCECEDVAVLKISIPEKRLDYLQPEALPFPALPTNKGLIIDGGIPLWLLTALVRLYKEEGLSWIAPYHPPLGQAVVSYSHVVERQPGELIPMPTC